MEHPGVREAVVMAREDTPGDKRLVAYYTVSGEQELVRAEQLRAHLSVSLPEYMVPAAYVHLDALPLTPNGKLDRQALPVPELQVRETNTYVSAQNKTQLEILEIWKDILKREDIGIHDPFFDIGGNSLGLVRVHDRLKAIFLGTLRVSDLFAHPTVSLLSEFLTRSHIPTLDSSQHVDIDRQLPNGEKRTHAKRIRQSRSLGYIKDR